MMVYNVQMGILISRSISSFFLRTALLHASCMGFDHSDQHQTVVRKPGIRWTSRSPRRACSSKARKLMTRFIVRNYVSAYLAMNKSFDHSDQHEDWDEED